MKRRHFLLSAMAMGVSAVAAKTNHFMETKKILVVYYSWSGNTRQMANQIKNATGGDIFEVVPVTPYSSNYQTVVDQAKKEMNTNFCPPLKTALENMDSYDFICIGSPNWWNTIAPPVATFLTTYNLKGKTIVPFITHEGSGMGKSVADIKKLCPDTTVLDGLSVRGGSVGNAQNEVNKWLKRIKIID